ncbi:MAG: hypothetical protein KF726_20635 [Anaerolineae bacterium]|nr:hypothetical protein [Anaerolineae bacterium]
MLIQSGADDLRRFAEIYERLLPIAEVIPLEVTILTQALGYSSMLAPQDAIIYTSILQHLISAQTESSCFLNRNRRDFANPDIEETLAHYACKLLYSFNDGLGFVKSQH